MGLIFAATFIVLLLLQPTLMRYLGRNQTTPPSETKPAAFPQAATPSAPVPLPKIPGGKKGTSEQELVIESDLYRITFSTRGALVKSWVLKRYTDDHGRPLELVPSNTVVETPEGLRPASERYGYPMSLWTYDEGMRNKLNAALYVSSATGHIQAPATITFDFSDGETVVRKVFTFDNSYVVKVQTSAGNKGQVLPAYLAWPAGFGDQTTPMSFAASRIDSEYADKVDRLEAKKVSGGNTERGPFSWAGTVDQYFGAVFLPDHPEDAVMVTLRSEVSIPKNLEKPDYKDMTKETVLGAAVGQQSGITNGRWFVGPKAIDVLESVKAMPGSGQAGGPNLTGLVDFGFFGWFGKPLFLWLKWTQTKIPNWGWAIAIQTIIINLALLPLRITSMKSAMKMQRVQPQVNAIKKKYEKFSMKDPRKAEMNKEISAVFKENGVNPAGGCLPMVVQLPFLWAYYTMLGAAIELRHAPWLWIHDLSAPDPLHILPVLIVVSTFLMQRMTPTAGMDPSQQKMMNLMMPIMLGFFSWSVASGLGLYWLLGTVIAIVQQLVMNRTSMGQEMRAIAIKRARRKNQA